MPGKKQQRCLRSKRLLLDASAFAESDEKPAWMQRHPNSAANNVYAASAHITTHHPGHKNAERSGSSPRGYDPDAPLFITAARIQTKGGTAVLLFVAKGDLSLQQLVGTMRVQLGLSRHDLEDAALTLRKCTGRSVVIMPVREDTVDSVLDCLQSSGGFGVIKVANKEVAM